MNPLDRERLISLLIEIVEERIRLDEVIQEIVVFENTKPYTVISETCHQLRHFDTDADLRAKDQAYDALMKKNLYAFIEKIRNI